MNVYLILSQSGELLEGCVFIFLFIVVTHMQGFLQLTC